MSSNLEKVQHKIIVRKISSQTGGLDPLKPRALKDLQAPERAGGRLKLTNPTRVRRKLQPELAQVLQIEPFVFTRRGVKMPVWRCLDTNESEIAEE